MSAPWTTPEPWERRGKQVWGATNNVAHCIGQFDSEHDCQLAVDCILALAGVVDPPAELARLRQCEAALLRIMDWWEADGVTSGSMPAPIYEAAQAALGKPL